MFVTAEIPQDGPAQLQIPAKAMFFQGGKNFVFVGGQTPDRLPASKSARRRERRDIAILAGVQPGLKCGRWRTAASS
jgi:hypothetical protein